MYIVNVDNVRLWLWNINKAQLTRSATIRSHKLNETLRIVCKRTWLWYTRQMKLLFFAARCRQREEKRRVRESRAFPLNYSYTRSRSSISNATSKVRKSGQKNDGKIRSNNQNVLTFEFIDREEERRGKCEGDCRLSVIAPYLYSEFLPLTSTSKNWFKKFEKYWYLILWSLRVSEAHIPEA